MDVMLNDFRNGYVQLCKTVWAEGRPVSPRNLSTREVQSGRFILPTITRTLPFGVNRKFSSGVAAIEACQLIAGISYPELMMAINPTFERFTSQTAGNLYFHGAYGPRVRQQVRDVVTLLRRDPDSRQAVVTIYDGARDFADEPDIPCTLSLQFMLRHNYLHCHATMRSNDVWWGAAYDVFQFTQLQWTLATVLGADPGMYFHTAGSLHAYERDQEAIDQLVAVPRGTPYPYLPPGLADPGMTIEDAQERAAWLLKLGYNTRRSITFTDDPAGAWYLRHMRHRARR